MNKDGGNATAMTTAVTMTTSRTSREREREEIGEARKRTEDKQKQCQRGGGDERGWRQWDSDGNNDDDNGDYKPNIESEQLNG